MAEKNGTLRLKNPDWPFYLYEMVDAELGYCRGMLPGTGALCRQPYLVGINVDCVWCGHVHKAPAK